MKIRTLLVAALFSVVACIASAKETAQRATVHVRPPSPVRGGWSLPKNLTAQSSMARSG